MVPIMPDERCIYFLPDKPSSKNPASGSKGINNKAQPKFHPKGRTWSIGICNKSFIIWYMALPVSPVPQEMERKP
jgi:hypothetical protein